jgi:hypothetical protein
MSFNLKSKGKFAALLAALIISVSVTGCTNTDEKTSSTNSSTVTKDSVSTASIASDESLDSDMFTDRDKEVGYDESSAVIFHHQVQPQALTAFLSAEVRLLLKVRAHI